MFRFFPHWIVWQRCLWNLTPHTLAGAAMLTVKCLNDVIIFTLGWLRYANLSWLYSELVAWLRIANGDIPQCRCTAWPRRMRHGIVSLYLFFFSFLTELCLPRSKASYTETWRAPWMQMGASRSVMMELISSEVWDSRRAHTCDVTSSHSAKHFTGFFFFLMPSWLLNALTPSVWL